MKNFKVYRHPTLGTEAVKRGFSWPAFFFGFFWMLAKKLWGLAGLWFVAFMVCTLIEKVADASAQDGAAAVVYLLLAAAYFSLWLVPAFKGNGWRESNLQRRGFALVAELQAETPDAAVAQAASAA